MKKQKGISLIVLVITIIVIIILATAVIVTIVTNNPIKEANKAKYESDRDNMQAVFTNTVVKIMANNQGNVKITAGQMNNQTIGVDKTTGQVNYTVKNAADTNNANGVIVFDKGENTTTKYYTGVKLPIYKAGETKWYVDEEGVISLLVNEIKYGDGELPLNKGLNHPKLPGGATPVMWDEKNEEKEVNSYDENWYDYKEQTATTEAGGTSRWANCKMEDGSYFVWIPRYAYKITYNDASNKSKGGIINVKFTKYENGVDVAYDGSSLDGYIVHPAFTNNVEAGGWDRNLDGIWIAKYEAGVANSNGNSGDSVKASSISGKNLPIFKPNRKSYVSTTIGDAFQIAKEYYPSVESHMMKNSEWGAVAYLAHSQYGRNGTEITINNSNTIITGNAGDTVSAVQIAGAPNPYNTEKGMLASTTGNITGIYDLSGGAWERTAGYINNNDPNLTNNGKQLINEGEIGKSNKYKTVYAYNTGADNSENNYNMEENQNRVGKAIWETSKRGIDNTSWNGDYSNFPYTSLPFLYRGGSFYIGSSAGNFYFGNTGGISDIHFSFRVTLPL